METSGVVYEADCNCNNCFKRYTGETARKLKERMKEHKDDGKKSQKDQNITDFSQHEKQWSFPFEVGVRIIYRENNQKKRKFKVAAKKTSHNKEQLINKKDERKTISNLWNTILNHKT